MKDPRERRRYPRYDVGNLPGVVDGLGHFQAIKLSIGGALIMLPAELSLDQEVYIALELGEAPFRSPAYVVFVGPDLEEHGQFRIGLAFADTPEEDRARLVDFLARADTGSDRG